MIKCVKCEIDKEESDFQRRADNGKLRGVCRACRSKDNLARYHTNPETREAADRSNLKHYLAKRYGVTPEWYYDELKKQNGVCAICEQQCFNRLAVDHCHVSGKVRGLLCQSCNTALGHFRDKPELLRKAAQYLEESSDKTLSN